MVILGFRFLVTPGVRKNKMCQIALYPGTFDPVTNGHITHFDGLVVDFAHKIKAKVIVRGVRMLSDFEYEFQMALTNRKLSSDIETIFLMPHESYSYLSAKLIKEASVLGADLSSFVPDFVAKALQKKLRKKK